MLEAPKDFDGLNITINTNEDCNLACKYCYEINKKHKVLPLDYAKKFIDIILTDPDPIGCIGTESQWIIERGLIIDFIGGDSFMHPDLMDNILNYFIYKSTILEHKWRNDWRISISSNGTLFDKKEVRDFISKWKETLSLGISIDGCPAIHDRNRIFAERDPNGGEIGSMPTIIKWWPWLQENCPQATDHTKATCNKDSIPYLYESLQFMHEGLGITNIYQNFIMEDTGCTDEDYIILEEQLDKCVEYVFNHRDEIYWSMIDENSHLNSNIKAYDEIDSCRCGSGAMPALGINGKIYPCFRWLPHTQEQEWQSENYCVGDIWKGINRKENFAKIREQTRLKISPPECIECECESACPYCIAGCYSEFGCFKRTTYICEIIKIVCKAADKYWKKIEMLKQDTDPRLINKT
jgi:uncharacterized protein